MRTIYQTIFIACLCVIFLAGCKDEPGAGGGNELPSQDSDILVVTGPFVDDSASITLSNPKPFQTIDATDDIPFSFSQTVSTREVLIFDQKPNIDDLRLGIRDGCIAGNSTLAGHTGATTSASLSQTPANNHFYQCQSSGDLLSTTDKQTLSAGTYYWFVLGYDDNYLVSQSSDVRILFLQ